MPRRTLVVEPRDHGRRLDVYLRSRFAGMSRTSLAGFVSSGLITSGSRSLKPSSRLATGEVIDVAVPGLAPTSPPPPLPAVLWEDARLLALDKPAGMLCHPSGAKWEYAVIGLCRAARPDARIDLVHRLDRETSGTLLLTKDLAANQMLKESFRLDRVKKSYLAVVRGVVAWERQDLEAPIGPAFRSAVRLRRGVREDGSYARTAFEVVRRGEQATLVACRLYTGRTHQIRVHLEHLGHPILGDKLYGQPDEVFLDHLERGVDVTPLTGFDRQALHAHTLEFSHPDGQTIQLEAPLPADLDRLVSPLTPSAGEP